jgi:3-hydroxy-3-methylglutaryl CoA synthase
LSLDGKQSVDCALSGSKDDAVSMGVDAAENLVKQSLPV